MAPLLMLVVGMMVLLASTALVVPTGRPVSATRVDGFLAACRLPPTAPSRTAVDRFLARTADFGRTGMIAGFVVAVVLGVAWHRQITLGFGPSPVGDLATMGLGGWFAGLVLSARSWRRRPLDAPRTVLLVPRGPDRYRPRWLARLTVALAAAAVALAPATFVVPAALGHRASFGGRAAAVLLALAAVALLAATERVHRRIANRPQAVVSPDLLAVDEALRQVTSRAIGFAAAGLLVLVAGWQLSFAVREGWPEGGSWAGAAVGIAMLAAGMALAARARRTLRPRPPAAVGPVPT